MTPEEFDKLVDGAVNRSCPIVPPDPAPHDRVELTSLEMLEMFRIIIDNDVPRGHR